MKGLIFFLLISITVHSQQKDLLQFSEIFKNYSNYKQLIVQYPGGFSGQKWTHYRIIFKEKGNWFLADHYVSPIKLFSDSIVVTKCNNCELIYEQVLSKETELKSESEITAPCRKLTPTITKMGDSAIDERNLDLETHVGSQILEYRIKKKKRSVWQRTPEVALAICPESIQRRVFLDLLNAIKNAR